MEINKLRAILSISVILVTGLAVWVFKDTYAFAGFFFLFLTLPKKEKIFMGICPDCGNRVIFSASITSLNEEKEQLEEEDDD